MLRFFAARKESLGWGKGGSCKCRTNRKSCEPEVPQNAALLGSKQQASKQACAEANRGTYGYSERTMLGSEIGRVHCASAYCSHDRTAMQHGTSRQHTHLVGAAQLCQRHAPAERAAGSAVAAAGPCAALPAGVPELLQPPPSPAAACLYQHRQLML